METQTQQQQQQPKKSTRTKLFLYYTTPAGETRLSEFFDKGELDHFIQINDVKPISVIRGNEKRFKNRIVFA